MQTQRKFARFRALTIAAAGAAVLAACANPQTEDLVTAPEPADPYREALVDGYIGKANFEEYKMRDYDSAEFYANKGKAVLAGKTIVPEDPAAWGVGADQDLGDMKTGRQQFMSMLHKGVSKKAPTDTAQAMVNYDCWVEQSEEGFQPAHIARCRTNFYEKLASMEAAMRVQTGEPKAKVMPKQEAPKQTAAAPAVKEPAPANFLLFFDWDSATLTDEAKKILSVAASEARESDDRDLVIVGHADRSGAASYNQRLSERRANSVLAELAELGLATRDVDVEAKGESDPLVPTGDGVREPQNRRVKITIMGAEQNS